VREELISELKVLQNSNVQMLQLKSAKAEAKLMFIADVYYYCSPAFCHDGTEADYLLLIDLPSSPAVAKHHVCAYPFLLISN
jgi:hypothetical protein